MKAHREPSAADSIGRKWMITAPPSRGQRRLRTIMSIGACISSIGASRSLLTTTQHRRINIEGKRTMAVVLEDGRIIKVPELTADQQAFFDGIETIEQED